MPQAKVVYIKYTWDHCRIAQLDMQQHMSSPVTSSLTCTNSLHLEDVLHAKVVYIRGPLDHCRVVQLDMHMSSPVTHTQLH